MTTNICDRTNTRRAACLCGACAIGASPERKRAANKRDVLALLDMLNATVQHHPEFTEGSATWAKASGLAGLRQQLRDIAISLARRGEQSEEEAVTRFEAALGCDDGDVGMALVDAL